MEWFDDSALTLAVFLPLLGAVVVAVLPRERDGLIRAAALGFAGLALLVGVGMLARFDYDAGAAMQFEVSRSWIPAIGAGYHLGVDGIALPLLVLSLLLSLLCVVYSFRILPEPRNPKAFLALLLLLETGMNGTFAALDLVLFFVFWETVLVPMYFLIAVWGGPRRDYASIKFILYTLIGSVVMLLGFLALWLRSSPEAAGRTFDMLALQDVGAARFGGTFGTIVFAAVALGFAVKVPVWPFHTWLPDAHTEAPTVGSVLLAGILLKMGTYGFVRIALPILPDAAREWAPVIGVLGAIAIIYGALCCLAQRDVKRLIAYSSVGHMGFVMLGIATLTPTGINAAVFGMVAHGIVTGMLFFVFWETVLIPMYFMIAVWGGPRRDYASIKFILYTLIGSVIMLLGFLAIWLRSSPDAAGRTFDILALQEAGAAARFGGTFGTIVFAAVALGFAVKVPVWPLHTWLPDAHTEAPTVGSVLLAGILLKMGTYGFVRIALPILPDAAREWAPVIGILGAIAIIYGSLCCLAQRDVKRLIAYSSVGHMGFV
ncbi:MAG TPA: NADH-quinone oxidoreductase subunit M, partial [Actinomycetes bacterium]|nr:NADH-quinone oxidoreductase subunit M [Actinomycetes bacterium]